jgi:hypothetical protein
MTKPNFAIGHLRQLAADPGTTSVRRLRAIDALAALGNVFVTKETERLCPGPIPAGIRARASVRKLLRALLTDERFRPRWVESAIRERLLFISGVRVEIGAILWRVEAPEAQTQAPVKQEPVNEHVNEIDEFLKQHGVT